MTVVRCAKHGIDYDPANGCVYCRRPLIDPNDWRAVVAGAKELKVATAWCVDRDGISYRPTVWPPWIGDPEDASADAAVVQEVVGHEWAVVLRGSEAVACQPTLEAGKAAADAALLAAGWTLDNDVEGSRT